MQGVPIEAAPVTWRHVVFGKRPLEVETGPRVALPDTDGMITGGMGQTATCGHEARQEETTILAFDAREPDRLSFLSEIYERSAGDAHQGVPYEALIDALGCDERIAKRIHCDLQLEGVMELTTVPPMTHVSRPVMDHAPRQSRQQAIGMALQGVQLMEDHFATLKPTPPQASASPDPTTTA